MLSGYLLMQLGDTPRLPVEVRGAIAKATLYRELGARAKGVARGPCETVKGENLAIRYPANTIRESHDLDLIVRDERGRASAHHCAVSVHASGTH